MKSTLSMWAANTVSMIAEGGYDFVIWNKHSILRKYEKETTHE